MTDAQKKSRARFKAAVSEAAKLRKKNPRLSQADAVKQAWAILYGKERAGKKIAGAKKPAKKAVKKVLPKKRETKKDSIRKASPKSHERHKDTKSHNVNIRVMSGMDELNKRAAQNAFKELEWWQTSLNKLRAEYKAPGRSTYQKKDIREDMKEHKKWISFWKAALRKSISGIK